MSIRLRTQAGEVREVGDARFVEICNDAGEVAAVVFARADGAVRVLMDDDPDLIRYCTHNQVSRVGSAKKL